MAIKVYGYTSSTCDGEIQEFYIDNINEVDSVVFQYLQQEAKIAIIEELMRYIKCLEFDDKAKKYYYNGTAKKFFNVDPEIIIREFSKMDELSEAVSEQLFEMFRDLEFSQTIINEVASQII